MYCMWGKWFEQVTKDYLKAIYGYEIHEFSAIPCARIPVAYSPDGLFIKDNECWLLEIKCPFLKTKPKIDNYMDQIQAGLYILPVKKCLLCMIIFRKCYAAQLMTKRVFDCHFHMPWFESSIYRPKSKMDEKFVGFLWWDALELQEKIEEKPYDKAHIGTVPEIMEKLSELKNGSFMCFKCFDIQEEVIEIYSLEKEEDFLWDQYNEFINKTK
ncbi:hypothetical protein RFI_24907 [Reticulomyxa filosa]|uniref:YqaJ viral recombinase domain-containing protein n=1 Tax=Reticulomyxa filosa TaxID=46433 RepID=X6MEN0_RETFI|nr:hypothetical protein RFI_24907 [Reticulomyxa filosa]|eukprot:ETO12463.1 hypothetical protein RFI_24907 [Reticulomyxa filosa]